MMKFKGKKRIEERERESREAIEKKEQDYHKVDLCEDVTKRA